MSDLDTLLGASDERYIDHRSKTFIITPPEKLELKLQPLEQLALRPRIEGAVPWFSAAVLFGLAAYREVTSSASQAWDGWSVFLAVVAAVSGALFLRAVYQLIQYALKNRGTPTPTARSIVADLMAEANGTKEAKAEKPQREALEVRAGVPRLAEALVLIGATLLAVAVAFAFLFQQGT